MAILSSVGYSLALFLFELTRLTHSTIVGMPVLLVDDVKSETIGVKLEFSFSFFNHRQVQGWAWSFSGET